MHVPRTSPFSSSVFHTASALSAPSGHLPLEGKALSVVILFSTYACIRSDNARKAAFSYRSLPQWGRGTAQRRSGALVNDALETISPDHFHPATAHPTSAPSGHLLPMEGGSVHAPLPMEGAAERSEAGLASFWGGEAPSSLPSPFGKGDRAATLSYTMLLRRSSRSLSYRQNPIRPPSWHLPHAGKALCRGQRHSHKCRACILRKQKPLCEDGLCRAVSGSIILRSRILRDFSAYPHHFLS